ncbi:MAG: arcC [Acidimicrobiales bacterium]|nr:arcC [Acidimicrobiales bacterium]
MRILVALGGNALLQRHERPDADIQQHHIDAAAAALAPLATTHELVITHGNGPQVGLLALESAKDPALTRPYPLDVLGAQTQGMIGYWLVQALRNTLPDREVAGVITQTVVAADDRAFDHPTKFVGPTYDEADARDLAAARGWSVARDGTAWRRVVPSPEPRDIVERALIGRLVADGTLVVCAGGGGVPVTRGSDGRLTGVEAVIDKDLTSALLAEAIGADALLLLTDVDAVDAGYGTSHPRPIGRATPAEMRSIPFPDGSMAPKVEAACRFVDATGGTAAIGSLLGASALLAGTSGTTISPGRGRAQGRAGTVIWPPERARQPRVIEDQGPYRMARRWRSLDGGTTSSPPRAYL